MATKPNLDDYKRVLQDINQEIADQKGLKMLSGIVQLHAQTPLKIPNRPHTSLLKRRYNSFCNLRLRKQANKLIILLHHLPLIFRKIKIDLNKEIYWKVEEQVHNRRRCEQRLISPEYSRKITGFKEVGGSQSRRVAEKQKEVSENRKNYISKFLQPQNRFEEESGEQKAVNGQFQMKMHGAQSYSQKEPPTFLKVTKTEGEKKRKTPTRGTPTASSQLSRTFKSSSKFLFINSPSQEHLTFKPEVDPVSRQIANRLLQADGRKRWEQLYELEKKKREKLEQKGVELQLSREEKETEECTFSPELTAKLPNVDITTGNIFKRNQIWEMEKKMKMEREKESIKDNEVKDCTFKPVTNWGRTAEPKQMINTSGVHKHLERQYIAKKAKMEKEQMILGTHDPKNAWKRGVTIPEDFSFDMPGKSIHGLMRPGKPNIWATGKFRKIMKSSRVDDILTFANSLNKTEEVKKIFRDPKNISVKENMDFSDAVDHLHSLLHGLDIPE